MHIQPQTYTGIERPDHVIRMYVSFILFRYLLCFLGGNKGDSDQCFSVPALKTE